MAEPQIQFETAGGVGETREAIRCGAASSTESEIHRLQGSEAAAEGAAGKGHGRGSTRQGSQVGEDHEWHDREEEEGNGGDARDDQIMETAWSWKRLEEISQIVSNLIFGEDGTRSSPRPSADFASVLGRLLIRLPPA